MDFNAILCILSKQIASSIVLLVLAMVPLNPPSRCYWGCMSTEIVLRHGSISSVVDVVVVEAVVVVYVVVLARELSLMYLWWL